MTPEEVKAFLIGEESRMRDERLHPKSVLPASAMNDLLADTLGQYEEEQPIQNPRARALGWRIIPRTQL